VFDSLATRLIAWTLALTGAVFVTTIGLSNLEGRQAAIAAAEREAHNSTEAVARDVEDILDAVEASTAALARTVSELRPGPDALGRLVNRFSADQREKVLRYSVMMTGSDPAAPAWYQEARDRDGPGWSEPHRDAETATATVITWATPIRGPDGRFAGAAAASLRLTFLSAAVRGVHLGASGFGVVLSRRGLLVAHSRRDLSGRVHDPLAELPPDLSALVEPIVRRAQAGESGFAAVPLDGRVFRLTFRPIANAGWFLATAYAEDELLADVARLRRTQIALAGSGLAILAGAVVMLSRRITRPLKALAASAGQLATGDLDGPLPSTASRDEVGALTTAFYDMRDSLKEYIRNLKETTAAKERLEGELKTARRIQADMLPSPTAGGGSSGYELSAALVPARAVGGDLFDHFEQNRHVFFLVGDVSGKGVAAALFMARAKTLFDAATATERNPGVVLAAINRSLCRQNETGMYVTAVCGVLDLDASTVTFATAGHEPPVLVRRDGHSASVATEGGGVLGLMEIGDYPVTGLTLDKGDALVMFTDGVSEAQDRDGGFFGTERLLDVTTRYAAGTASAMTAGVLHEVNAFAAAAPQSDDITILTLKLPLS
jgi:phosphoserine phosphatase RsbU/P